MERKEFLEKVLAYGRQAGFADCEVYYRGGKAFEVLILEGEVSDYENSREEGLAFRGNINGRTGYAYTEQDHLMEAYNLFAALIVALLTKKIKIP